MRTKRLLKISMAWVSIAYVVCYVLFFLVPQTRGTFIYYAVHMNVNAVPSVFTFGNFIGGFVFWNVLVAASVWLWVFLVEKIKN
ncbi:hypothetical protein A3D66_01480 [Candidatus Kaiserbacteria bacterium RIFCSPHIGHO2_02_FULL_50_9]|uniref:Uncharacterized protein n=1 Tax=Candidatus Kaiserbacteria bacterium RIFCSPLOWO2_01_FULL_51_21 TaxID=1798508 RepID=A0A1F6ED28_9BACT|nr:MAG: hypothetical protein A2761_02035 [Candidatus Kaiserbacteria bacterium RIFCSPHIGHO2_01_FULL_51_33]OGG63717.1 MAG: hypothetical protein A3D66_01480 [Candidatus Kaiserbacteria bacterium RIFCSPHIGHO2_02_FULL_50_9]OGG71510.1 MAG: hypothetical protein A3A35_02130 [Candidatus Kaiserbacteria bacterium RIFCSPLOWO2_01_FULL_51_21]